MINLLVTYTCKKDKREAFLNTIKDNKINIASLNEEGNIKYEYYFSDLNKDDLLLIECWENEEAFTKHKETSHFKELSLLKEQYVIHTSIEKFMKL